MQVHFKPDKIIIEKVKKMDARQLVLNDLTWIKVNRA